MSKGTSGSRIQLAGGRESATMRWALVACLQDRPSAGSLYSNAPLRQVDFRSLPPTTGNIAGRLLR